MPEAGRATEDDSCWREEHIWPVFLTDHEDVE